MGKAKALRERRVYMRINEHFELAFNTAQVVAVAILNPAKPSKPYPASSPPNTYSDQMGNHA